MQDDRQRRFDALLAEIDKNAALTDASLERLARRPWLSLVGAPEPEPEPLPDNVVEFPRR
jgi:hypothetical protein